MTLSWRSSTGRAAAAGHGWLRGVAAGAALVAISACAGPTTPINASLKEFPQNIRIGAAPVKPALIAPVPPSAPQLTGGLFLPPAPRLDSQPAPQAPPTTDQAPVASPPAPPSCPTAGPGVTPLLSAGPAVLAAPQAATYLFRTDGEHTAGGAGAGTSDYPALSTRVVSAARAETDGAGGNEAFSYDVSVSLGDNRTITTYRVVPEASPLAPLASTSPGLFVTKIVTQDGTGKELSSFSPQPAMLVMPFPADTGTIFTVSSSDPSTGTVVRYTGTVGEHTVVDACGKVIDTRSVAHEGEVSMGTCGSGACQGGSTPATTFRAKYDIATQYGGLSVQDDVTVEGLGLDAPFTDVLRGTINRVPEAPQ